MREFWCCARCVRISPSADAQRYVQQRRRSICAMRAAPRYKISAIARRCRAWCACALCALSPPIEPCWCRRMRCRRAHAWCCCLLSLMLLIIATCCSRFWDALMLADAIFHFFSLMPLIIIILPFDALFRADYVSCFLSIFAAFAAIIFDFRFFFIFLRFLPRFSFIAFWYFDAFIFAAAFAIIFSRFRYAFWYVVRHFRCCHRFFSPFDTDAVSLIFPAYVIACLSLFDILRAFFLFDMLLRFRLWFRFYAISTLLLLCCPLWSFFFDAADARCYHHAPLMLFRRFRCFFAIDLFDYFLDFADADIFTMMPFFTPAFRAAIFFAAIFLLLLFPRFLLMLFAPFFFLYFAMPFSPLFCRLFYCWCFYAMLITFYYFMRCFRCDAWLFRLLRRRLFLLFTCRRHFHAFCSLLCHSFFFAAWFTLSLRCLILRFTPDDYFLILIFTADADLFSPAHVFSLLFSIRLRCWCWFCYAFRSITFRLMLIRLLAALLFIFRCRFADAAFRYGDTPLILMPPMLFSDMLSFSLLWDIFITFHISLPLFFSILPFLHWWYLLSLPSCHATLLHFASDIFAMILPLFDMPF